VGRAFVEPARVPEFFVSGLGYIDDFGDGNHRFAFFTKQDGEQIIRVKLVIATPNIYLGMQQTMTHLGYRCCGGQRSLVGMN
jgi:hypothetical protein